MKCSSLSLGLFCGIAASAVWWVRQRRNAKGRRRQYVWIGDPVKFQSKRRRVIAGGAKKLHVIADFDRTLTKCFISPGVRGVSAHGALERSPHLPVEYHNKARALFEKYHPLETTPELTIEQKIPLMKEWYRQGHELLIGQRFRREYITDAVRTAPLRMREGAKELMHTLARAGIPLLVLSAGLGDVLEEVLTQKCGPLPPTTHVISNRMVFDDEGVLVGFSEPLIHMFNKHETHNADAPYYQAVHNRRNVILLGDGLGDLDMAEGVDTDTIITIGFLNARIGELWERYIEAFDVVVVDDGDMSYVNELVQNILAGGTEQ